MSSRMLKPRRMPKEGAVVSIPLESGMIGYARVLRPPLMAFYAVQTLKPMPLPEVLRQPIAFKVWVMRSAVTTGRWPVIGTAPLEPDLIESPWFFKQDALNKSLSLYRHGIERPATLEECLGLECAAAWSAEHVERRLQDFFAGRPNKSVEALKIKP